MLKFPLFINCIMSEKINIKKEDNISIITLDDGKANVFSEMPNRPMHV